MLGSGMDMIDWHVHQLAAPIEMTSNLGLSALSRSCSGDKTFYRHPYQYSTSVAFWCQYLFDKVRLLINSGNGREGVADTEICISRGIKR